MPRFNLTPRWTLALVALPMFAQFQAELPGEVGAGLWPNSVPVASDAGPTDEGPGGTISAELLRYPISGKARRMLQRAVKLSEAGDHEQAATQLEETLAKFPGTGAYVYSLIGVEYLKTHRFAAAVQALEQAVKLLPHDASNHANLGLALVASGQSGRAEPELRRALELDPHYSLASKLLGMLELSRERAIAGQSAAKAAQSADDLAGRSSQQQDSR